MSEILQDDLNRVKGEAGSDEHLRDEPLNLDCLYIRRSDLQAAIRNLRKCTDHGPFRRP